MLQGTGARLAEGATKGTAYARTTVYPTSVTSPKHVSLLATLRSLGPFSIIVEGRISLVASYAKGTGCLHCMSFLCARILHLPARTLPSFARLPACLSWQMPRACERVWCLRGPLLRVCPALVCACLASACACALSCIWLTCSIAVSLQPPSKY